jgi:hypothetical protein
MNGLDRTQVITLVVVGIVASVAVAFCIRRLVEDFRNPKTFVAYGSMKNWYNQSPNFVFKLARKLFGSIKEKQRPSNKTTMQLRVPPKTTAATIPLHETFIADYIDLGHRVRIAEFVLRAIDYDPKGILTHISRTLRPGDLYEIRRLVAPLHHANAYQRPSVPQQRNCSYQPSPAPLPRRFTENDLDTFAGVLVFNDKFVLLCVKYAGFIAHLIEKADITTNPYSADGSTPPEHIPGQEDIGAFVNLAHDYFPEGSANR